MNIAQQTILVAEDDPNDILLIQRAFRRAELSTTLQVVDNGDAAIAYLAGEGKYVDREYYPLPTLLLLDLKMPRRSGFEVLQWLRQQPSELNRLPVTVLTASNQTNDIQRAYELGANSYLVKPVAFEQFLEMIRTLNLYWLTFNCNPLIESF